MRKKPGGKRRTSVSAPMANTGSEAIPPGARGDAFRRPVNDEHGPGEGAGPRHAADDPGSPNEEYGAVDTNLPAADPIPKEEDTNDAFGGHSGGAVGGTPAGRRARGGRTGRGIAPGEHRGDSTIGGDPFPKSK